MILECLDLLYVYYFQKMMDTTSSNINNKDKDIRSLYFQIEIRKNLGKLIRILIFYPKISKHQLMMNMLNLSINEYKEVLQKKEQQFKKEYDNITQCLDILELFSIITLEQKEKKLLIIFNDVEWEKKFNEAYTFLYNKFSENIVLLKKNVAYICSKKCNTNIYTDLWITQSNMKCENNHPLVLIDKKEKNEIINKFEFDFNMLKTISSPKVIINKIKEQYNIFEKDKSKDSVLSSSSISLNEEKSVLSSKNEVYIYLEHINHMFINTMIWR